MKKLQKSCKRLIQKHLRTWCDDCLKVNNLFMNITLHFLFNCHPHILNIIICLANGRGMWETENEVLQKLKDLYSDADDMIEQVTATI